jgi:tetratricopeptide (TPR) repeat protein
VAAEVMRRGMDDCPDLETIAAYLDRRLDERAREEIAEHIASCETCYFIFTEAAQTHVTAPAGEAGSKQKSAGWSMDREAVRRMLWPSAAALAAAAVVTLMVRTGSMPWQRSASARLQALVTTVGTERTIEPRLTGGFAYGPLRGALRGAESTAASISPDVRIAAAQIVKSVGSDRSAEALRLQGLAYLLTGYADRAVAAFEQAEIVKPGDAQISNDLSAAYLVRGARDGQAQDLKKALESADRALAANHALPEARFNRACALERLSMIPAAREAWSAYLAIDDRSEWAAEARTRLAALNLR